MIVRVFVSVGMGLMLSLSASHAQLASEEPLTGFYTSSGDCLLTDGSITLRSPSNQMTFHYDLAGNLMIVDVLSKLGGASPIGGQIWGGKTYYSSEAGMVLAPDSSVFSIESAGDFPGTAKGFYFGQSTRSWLGFEEILCPIERASLLAENLVDFKDSMSERFEIDLLTEFSSIRENYASAVKAFEQ